MNRWPVRMVRAPTRRAAVLAMAVCSELPDFNVQQGIDGVGLRSADLPPLHPVCTTLIRAIQTIAVMAGFLLLGAFIPQTSVCQHHGQGPIDSLLSVLSHYGVISRNPMTNTSPVNGHTILRVLVGSHAHGLASPLSDRDYRRVYVIPTANMFA